MQKSERHNVILDLVADRPIRRQADLARELRNRGFDVTQTSISRDLVELGIVKVQGQYARPELGTAGLDLFGVKAVEPAGDNLIVVRCSSGLASAAAVKIDGTKIRGIVGTIAGDDTIFVAVADRHDQKIVVKNITLLFAGV